MKPPTRFLPLVLAGTTAWLLTGCLFKPSAVSPRHFVLTPLDAPRNAPAPNKTLTIGVAPVKIPPYLLHNPLAIRHGSNEIFYSEQARWAESLDQGLQRTLAANLGMLLPAKQIYLSAGEANQVQLRVFVEVIRFDVSAEGKGTLQAWWRLTEPGTNAPIRSVQSEFTRDSASSNPEAVVQTLSELTAELSRTIAGVIREHTRAAASTR